jgi:hypothetical protein
MEQKKERPLVQSVLFSLNECCDIFDALCEINKFYKNIFNMNTKEREKLFLSQKTILTILSTTRDSFCVRITNLFDKRSDVHSLVNNFDGNAIEKLRIHPITIACTKARHNNIAHMGKKYTKWPNIDEITESIDLKKIIESIGTGILINNKKEI